MISMTRLVCFIVVWKGLIFAGQMNMKGSIEQKIAGVVPKCSQTDFTIGMRVVAMVDSPTTGNLQKIVSKYTQRSEHGTSP